MVASGAHIVIPSSPDIAYMSYFVTEDVPCRFVTIVCCIIFFFEQNNLAMSIHADYCGTTPPAHSLIPVLPLQPIPPWVDTRLIILEYWAKILQYGLCLWLKLP